MQGFVEWDWQAEETSRSADQNPTGSMYPIWYAAQSHLAFEYELSSIGDRRKDLRYLRLATLLDEDILQLHPDLEHLARAIVVHLHAYEKDNLQIEVIQQVYYLYATSSVFVMLFSQL